MRGSCLFIVNGLGMGNSTRCHAIIEHLVEHGVEVHILTSGNGLSYFSCCPQISSLEETTAFFYSSPQGVINGWKELKSLRRLRCLAIQKRQDLEKFLGRISVDVVVTDSEYSTGPARRRGIPIIGLNNADLVVEQYTKNNRVPGSIQSHFWLVEYPDFLFHRFCCDVVISPAPLPGKTLHPRIRRVGLILRRSVQNLVPPHPINFPSPSQIKTAVFMLSGSIFASKICFDSKKLPFQADVVGRSGTNVENVCYHGRLLDNVNFLKKADALVINGGFSAVSEAMALNKPTFVIPVPGHAEQHINARLVGDLGFGYQATSENVISKLTHLHACNAWHGMQKKTRGLRLNGARESADIICGVIAARHQKMAGAAAGNPR